MKVEREANEQNFSATLSNSMKSDALDLLSDIGDAGLDKLVSSGALDGIPVIGLLHGAWKAAVGIRDHLYLRQIAKFLQEFEKTSKSDRAAFVDRLEKSGEFERFGESILLMLSQVDDSVKPRIVGRLVAAHISGKIPDFSMTKRLIAIVNRVYVEDIDYLRSFKEGVQKNDAVSTSLFSAGLLSNTGFDGGGADQYEQPGGVTYALNEYAELLLEYGF